MDLSRFERLALRCTSQALFESTPHRMTSAGGVSQCPYGTGNVKSLILRIIAVAYLVNAGGSSGANAVAFGGSAPLFAAQERTSPDDLLSFI